MTAISKYAPTHAGLWLARRDYAALREAATLIRGAGGDLASTADKVRAAADKIGREVITIPLRCHACQLADVPTVFTVCDPEQAEPCAAAVTCGPCKTLEEATR